MIALWLVVVSSVTYNGDPSGRRPEVVNWMDQVAIVQEFKTASEACAVKDRIGDVVYTATSVTLTRFKCVLTKWIAEPLP